MLFKQPVAGGDLLHEILSMSQEEKYLDTTLLCSHGDSLRVSSLLLITIFPGMRDAMRWRIREEDPLIISLPDIQKRDLEAFLDFVHNGTPTFTPSDFISQLLQTPVNSTRKVKEDQVRFMRQSSL